MLPANRRLTTEFFNETIAGRAFHSAFFTVRAIRPPGKSSNVTRFSATASKKYFKTAVSRNRERRRIYSAISKILPLVAEGFFIVILIKPETSKLKPAEIGSALEDVFLKAGIMKKTGNKVS